MPRRRSTTRRRSDDRVIEGMRAMIHAGIPWRHPASKEERFGHFDLIALVAGHFYPFVEFCTEEDEASQRALWEVLRDDILAQHVKAQPGTRPWAFWIFETTERRRCWGYDTVEDFLADRRGKRIDLAARLEEYPVGARTPRKANYFGMLGVQPGLCVYESEADYLERHGLLGEEEKRWIANQ